MVRRSRMLLIALAAALVGTAAAAGRALPDAAAGRALLNTGAAAGRTLLDTGAGAGRQLLDASDPVGQVAGLELVQSAAGVGTFTGRTLSDTNGSWPTSLFLSSTGNGTHSAGVGSYSDTILSTNLTSGNGTTPFATAGLGINSDPLDAIAKPFLWLMDIGGNVVYKIDTGSGAVAGAFNSQPINGATRRT